MFNWFRRNTEITRSWEDPSVSLSSASAYDYFSSGSTASGIKVNAHSVLGLPGVLRGLSLIANKISTLPLHVHKRNKDDSRERAVDHPAYRLLKYRPSPHYPAGVWKKTTVFQTLLHGNSYDFIVSDDYAKPLELRKLDPQQTFPVLEGNTLWYATKDDGRFVRYPAWKILHVRGLSDDGFTGLSILDIGKDALSYGLALQRYGAIYFKHGGTGGRTVLKVPAPIANDKEKRAELRDAWGSMTEGTDNAYRPSIISNQTEVSYNSNTNEQSQYNESTETALIMISNLMGIPPHKVGAKITSSYNSLIEENQAFTSDSLGWLLTAIEEQCREKLLSEEEKQFDTHYIEFLREGLIQIDPETEAAMLLADYHGGALSYSEYRKKRNMPVEKEHYAEWLLPSTVVVGLPEKPPESQQQPPEAQADVTEDNATEKLTAMAKNTVARLMTRIEKSVESGKIDMANHKEIFRRELGIFGKPEVIDQLFEGLADELAEVLPEQRAEVVRRINQEEFVEELWKKS